MKIKNRDILRFANSAFGGKHWPVKLAFAISVNSEAVAAPLKAFDESRKKLAEEYAEKDADGKAVIEDNQYKIKDPVAFSEAYNELEEMEAEVNITTVKMKDIAKCDEPGFDTMSVSEMAVLKFMVE